MQYLKVFYFVIFITLQFSYHRFFSSKLSNLPKNKNKKNSKIIILQKNNDISKSQKITICIGICCDYPPYEYIDKKDKINGLNVQVLNYLIKKFNQYNQKKIELLIIYKIISFEEGFLLLNKGKIDIFAGSTTANPEREKNFMFLGPIFITKGCLISHNNKFDNIGVQIGTIYDDYAMKFYKNKKIIKCSTVLDMLFLFQNKKIDTLFLNIAIEDHSNNLKNIPNKIIVEDLKEEIFFALRKKNLNNNIFDEKIKDKLLEIFNKKKQKILNSKINKNKQ